jgi:hypothetical protein
MLDFVTALMARARHHSRRVDAYWFASEGIRETGFSVPFALRTIDNQAMACWRTHWKHHPSRTVSWDWEEIRRMYRARYDRFDFALWSDDQLCGLSMGRFSRNRTRLNVNWIEGAPHPHPLKGLVLQFVAETATVLAFRLSRFPAA